MSRSVGGGSGAARSSPLPELHAAATSMTVMESQRRICIALSYPARRGGEQLLQRFREAYKIGEHPIRTGHAGGQLTKPRVGRVNVASLADIGVDLAAALRLLARVRRLEQRGVTPVKRTERIEVAILHPAVEVGRRDDVRRSKDRMARHENGDRRGFV